MRRSYPVPMSQETPGEREEVTRRSPWRILGYSLLAIAGLLAGFLIYILILLGQPLRTQIDIVSSFEPISLDNIQLTEADDSDVPWLEGGRTRVYVHEKFPIRKVEQIDPDIENILVFGIDSRGSSNVVCRADSLIIVSIDRKHQCIKLTSIMRDSQVAIAGRSAPNRINAAYAYGGVGLLINTINDTFDLDIQRFAMFDFWSAASLIDSLGGVDLTVKSKELPYLNKNLTEMNALTGQASALVEKAGTQHLNGLQAIAWARIRKLDSDYVRTSRQRTVMVALIDKYSAASLSSLIGLTNNGLSAFETNMTNADMLRLAFNSLPLSADVLEYRVPEDGMYTVKPDPWMMVINLDEQIPALHGFIYGDD
jgi:polyisoprenyl-teichoic acid--peptidoglycan teichoic acid transferase